MRSLEFPKSWLVSEKDNSCKGVQSGFASCFLQSAFKGHILGKFRASNFLKNIAPPDRCQNKDGGRVCFASRLARYDAFPAFLAQISEVLSISPFAHVLHLSLSTKCLQFVWLLGLPLSVPELLASETHIFRPKCGKPAGQFPRARRCPPTLKKGQSRKVLTLPPPPKRKEKEKPKKHPLPPQKKHK